jgi:serine protease Do
MKKTLFIIFTFFIYLNVFPKDSNFANQLSKTFTTVAKNATPAVVYIKTEINNANSTFEGSQNPFDVFNDDFFRKFFNVPQQKGPQLSSGSGFLVSKDGYILTNSHVINEADKITVILNNQDEFEAKLIGQDPRTDLAVIKIEGKDLPYLEFGNSDDLEIAEWVMAIGSPFQFQSSVTVGVVSAKGRQDLKITDLEDFIQTDAALNPGNSGGPLLDLDSKVIGINTALASQSGGYMGIGFAIPSNMAKHVMQEIIETGSVNRGYLGIYLQEIDKNMKDALELDKKEGVLIAEVIQNSAAEKAGLKQGDIIIAMNDKEIKTIAGFKNDIAKLKPSEIIFLTVLRDGNTKKIKVTLDKTTETNLVKNIFPKLGIEVSAIQDISLDILKKYGYDHSLDGVIITSVKNNSLGLQSGLRPGMIILQINNRKIKNLEDFNNNMKTIESKKNVLMLVKYQNITKFISIKLK